MQYVFGMLPNETLAPEPDGWVCQTTLPTDAAPMMVTSIGNAPMDGGEGRQLEPGKSYRFGIRNGLGFVEEITPP